jgi:hypothetical protein
MLGLTRPMDDVAAIQGLSQYWCPAERNLGLTLNGTWGSR